VIPPAHAEDAGRLMAQHEQLFCSLDTDGGPGMGGHGEGAHSMGGHGIQSFQPASSADGVATSQTFQADDGRVHFNLLGWNGQGAAPNLFPEGGTT
jgi:nitrate reductase / nitrite oxidoreductase, beta subunit